MSKRRGISRREVLKLGAGAAAAAALPLVHIRTARAAGKLSVGFWDHWVPAGNDAMRKQVDAWAKKNKVDVSMDFITTVGNKNLLTLAAEAQAKTGHDVQTFPTWEVGNHTQDLEPVDDVVDGLQSQYGKVISICEYLAKLKGHWLAVPSSSGTQYKPSCARISFFKEHGFDVRAVYPAKPGHTALSDQWTWDTLLKYAEPAMKANLPFALGLGQTTDCVDWTGALFTSFGAELVDAKGNITVKSDAVKQALEYMAKLTKYLPEAVYSYDDASNNRALISGKTAFIFNPPSAWAVAKRDNPSIAADCWTFPTPAGPKGRFNPYLPYFWGIWSFSPNKSAAKELITYLSQREQVEQRCAAVSGYDIPPFLSMTDFKVWSDVTPPPGTVYNYPIRPWHNTTPSIAAYPAPRDIAVQIYNRATMTNMVAKLAHGQSMDQVLSWAQDELEGFTRG
ncbi:MAG TPA: extracellular solute-binding protein [Candidatus Methylomirabilis sp.]|nr:extracellular solute-binding protein [Candidatus Methylomirabilis sp.]